MIMNKLLEWLKYVAFLIITVFVYEFLQTILLLPFMKVLNDLPLIIKSLLLLISESCILIVLFIIYHKLIIENFKDFKTNWKKYLPKGIAYWVIGFIGMGVVNILINITLGTGVAENEALNREIITKLPLYAIPAIALIGPMIEEIVFRLSFRKVIPNKFLFIVITSIIFAGVHMIASFNSISEIFTNIPELLHVLSYLCLALAFAFAYRDTDNIFTTMFLHIMHNTYCLILIIVTFLG